MEARPNYFDTGTAAEVQPVDACASAGEGNAPPACREGGYVKGGCKL